MNEIDLKIVRLETWQLPLTSHVTYYMAGGKTCDAVTTTVVRLTSDNGLHGWGEVCPIPHYLPAYAGGVIPALRELWPVLTSQSVMGVEAVMAALDHHLPGHVYAKSVLDIALWDLTARQANLPVYGFMGGRHNQALPLYHSISCLPPETMAQMARDAYATGIRQFQVKLGSDQDWRQDVERLMAVRDAVGDGPLVYGDWNCGSSQLDATRTGRAVKDLDIMLEQPCRSLEECAAVKRATGLPMKIDEGAHDTASLLKAHELGCLDAVALKLSKFGGLSALRRARDLCDHLGARLCIEDTWGSDIATAAALHLATATKSSMILNVCDLSGYVGPRLDPSAPTRKDGQISLPDGVGLGVAPDETLLGKPLFEVEAS